MSWRRGQERERKGGDWGRGGRPWCDGIVGNNAIPFYEVEYGPLSTGCLSHWTQSNVRSKFSLSCPYLNNLDHLSLRTVPTSIYKVKFGLAIA